MSRLVRSINCDLRNFFPPHIIEHFHHHIWLCADAARWVLQLPTRPQNVKLHFTGDTEPLSGARTAGAGRLKWRNRTSVWMCRAEFVQRRALRCRINGASVYLEACTFQAGRRTAANVSNENRHTPTYLHTHTQSLRILNSLVWFAREKKKKKAQNIHMVKVN